MGLPQYLAMTAAEMSAVSQLPTHIAWMACHFSPCAQGLSNLPTALPKNAMVIVTDRTPCQGHAPGLVREQLMELVSGLGCGSILLDFQRPPEPEALTMVAALTDGFPCPVAVSEGYAANTSGPVFLSPAPLHQPMHAHLAPWQGRELWLEAALCQEAVTVTSQGAAFAPQFPPDRLEGGFFHQRLCCHYLTQVRRDVIRFTLYDTPASLAQKIEQAEQLGVSRIVGLYQQLGRLPH